MGTFLVSLSALREAWGRYTRLLMHIKGTTAPDVLDVEQGVFSYTPGVE